MERSGKIKEKEVEKDMATVKVKCPYCGSEEVVLYGKNSKGRQRYLCQNKEYTHKTFYLNGWICATPPLGRNGRYFGCKFQWRAGYFNRKHV